MTSTRLSFVSGNSRTNEKLGNETRTIKQVILDIDGDLILFLKEHELRVSSKVLSVSSSVFKALFKPGFAEGNALADRRGLGRIDLLDDDPGVMTAMCSVIHGRPDILPLSITLELLESLAILTDKYDCSRALFSFGGHILCNRLRSGPPNCYPRLLAPAYLLDNYVEFQMITHHMAYFLNGTEHGCFTKVGFYGLSANIREMLPEDLLRKLFPQTINIWRLC